MLVLKRAFCVTILVLLSNAAFAASNCDAELIEAFRTNDFRWSKSDSLEETFEKFCRSASDDARVSGQYDFLGGSGQRKTTEQMCREKDYSFFQSSGLLTTLQYLPVELAPTLEQICNSISDSDGVGFIVKTVRAGPLSPSWIWLAKYIPYDNETAEFVRIDSNTGPVLCDFFYNGQPLSTQFITIAQCSHTAGLRAKPGDEPLTVMATAVAQLSNNPTKKITKPLIARMRVRVGEY